MTNFQEFANFFIYDTFFWFGVFGIGSIVLSWALLYRRERRLEKMERHFHVQAEHLLEHANKQALEILERAEGKAGRIISDTEFVDTKVATELQKDFRHIFTDNETKLSRVLQELQESNKQAVDKVMSSLLVESKGAVASYVDTLKEKSAASHSTLQEQLDNAYQAALTDIAAYKKTKLAEVDKNIGPLLLQISQEFFGKVVSLPDHEQLVFESLERAKREGVFK